MKHATAILRIAVLITLLIGLIGIQPVTAGNLSPQATIQVTIETDEYNTSGSGTGCSLREAIQAANSDTVISGCSAGNGADTILLPSGTYTLTINGVNNDTNATGDLDITTDDLTITGQGAGATINAGGIDRVMDILAGATLTLENIAITGGRAPDGNGDEPDGGGLRSYGSLTLIGVTISSNQAGKGAGGASNAASGGSGGGIYSDGLSLTITDSIIIGNTAGAGEDGKPLGFGGVGGGIATDGGTNTITNSVIRDNTAGAGGASTTSATGGSGGGMYLRGPSSITASTISGNTAGSSSTSDGGQGGGFFANSTTTIINCTVSGNTSGSSTAGSGSPGHGGGIIASSDMLIRFSTVTNNHTGTGTNSAFGGGIFSQGTDYLTMGATIVAGNMDDDNIYPDCYQGGAIISEDYNLIGDTRGCTLDVTPAHNILDPVGFSLLPLGNYGGLTQTHALTGGSPAVDHIPQGSAGCGTTYTTDQRGMPRPYHDACEIGAFELPLLGFLPLILR